MWIFFLATTQKKIRREYEIEIDIFENKKANTITWTFAKKYDFLVQMLCTATLIINANTCELSINDIYLLAY